MYPVDTTARLKRGLGPIIANSDTATTQCCRVTWACRCCHCGAVYPAVLQQAVGTGAERQWNLHQSRLQRLEPHRGAAIAVSLAFLSLVEDDVIIGNG